MLFFGPFLIGTSAVGAKWPRHMQSNGRREKPPKTTFSLWGGGALFFDSLSNFEILKSMIYFLAKYEKYVSRYEKSMKQNRIPGDFFPSQSSQWVYQESQ